MKLDKVLDAKVSGCEVLEDGPGTGEGGSSLEDPEDLVAKEMISSRMEATICSGVARGEVPDHR